jgi:hypothetical protein
VLRGVLYPEVHVNGIQKKKVRSGEKWRGNKEVRKEAR